MMRAGALPDPAPARSAKGHIDKRPSSAIDATDFALLAALHHDPLASHDALAGAVSLSASAVRKRLARLRDDGVLHGFVSYPVADSLGRVAVGAAWEAKVALDDLLALEDTAWAADSVDGRSGAMAYTREPERWRAAADSLAGLPPIQFSRLPSRPVPPPGPLEWRVALAMLDRPTGTLRELAHACGLSPRTVASRRAKLLQTGTMVIEPLLRTSRRGALVYHVNVRGARGAWAAARAALEESLVVADYADSAYLFCGAPDLATQVRRVEAARRVPGVERLDVVLNHDFRMATARMRGWMQDALEAWAAARRDARAGDGRQQTL